MISVKKINLEFFNKSIFMPEYCLNVMTDRSEILISI